MSREWILETNTHRQGICFPIPASCSLLSVHLQWFADDDEDAPGKTEQPTEHKLKRLREEGQVVKSQELIGALGLLLPAILLLFLAPSMLRRCVEMVRFFFTRAVELDPTQDRLIVVVFLRYFVSIVWPVLLVAVFAAIFSNIMQVGFLFSTKPITPNFSKVLPKLGKFFKQIFSVDGAYNLIKSLTKIAIIGVVAYVLIYIDIEKLLNLQKADIWTGFSIVTSIAIKMLIIAAVLMLIMSIPDYMFQRWRFRERNKMTRHEIKEEMKMYESDPQIQSRIRRRFRELLRQNIAAEVPKADVVITNPTHLAIALRYDQSVMPGPTVTAIGADEMAAKIRDIAQEHEVPLVENKALAWALYRETDVGDIIPFAYWNTVALILSKVWRLNEERRRRISA
ncbi:MAG: flagellar biosynthesis protein FlhB [Treponema sp.]|jgi:flagellar biosynthetic protein FlhB|nr:flagellar biosynthesis protein FlhB [Treponema sp.]